MTQVLSRDALGRAFLASPEERISLYQRVTTALSEAAFRLGVLPEVVRKARGIVLRRLFAENRVVLEPPDLYALACRAIGEAGAQSSGLARCTGASALERAQLACSPQCLWFTVGRIRPRLSAVELAVIGFDLDGLSDDEIMMVLGVSQGDLVAMCDRIMEAMRDLRCDHVKAAFPDEGDPRD